jgi:hypothetical protein
MNIDAVSDASIENYDPNQVTAMDELMDQLLEDFMALVPRKSVWLVRASPIRDGFRVLDKHTTDTLFAITPFGDRLRVVLDSYHADICPAIPGALDDLYAKSLHVAQDFNLTLARRAAL